MASIEKLVKAFEALKVIQTPIDRPEEALVSTRFIKKETSLTKKDKTIHCNTIADIICCPSLRNIEDFHKFLGISIETFLACCDDSNSDVRMAANECLNRTIKNLMDTQLGRIQVELYKEIKKNGSSRSLRAALSRFADLCHLTRPAKCRPYVLNLFPSLVKISERTEEDLIQDTLRIAMTKIMAVLAPFATDSEIITLLNAFLPNLEFVMSSVRRTAATSLVVICQNSRKPQIFFSWLLNQLLQSFNRMNTISETNDCSIESQTSERILVGIFLCLKHMIPHLYTIPSHIEYESLKTFGVNQKQRELMAKDYDTITENLLQIYELVLHNIRYNNNNSVILSALEALLQLMKTPPKLILPYLIDHKGIDKSRIGSFIHSSPTSPMLSLHRNSRRMQSNTSLSCSSINVESLGEEEEVNICGVTSLDDKLDQSISFSEPSFQKFMESEQQLSKSIEEFNGSDITPEYENYESSLEMSRIESQKNDSELESNCDKHMNSRHSSTSGFQMTKLTYVDSEDINDIQISPSNTDASFDPIEERFNSGNIGDHMTANISSLEYCVRVLSSQFLLSGSNGHLISDRIIRVSIKSLALGCIAAIVRLVPKTLTIELFLENDKTSQKTGEFSQKVCDILQYSSHSDPQIRGQIAIIIGNFIHEVLEEPKNFNDFLLQNCSVSSYSEFPTLEDLLIKLSKIIFDEQNSSMAIKHGLTGLKCCLQSCLESNDSINLTALSLIDDLIELKQNPYWLVKAELLDVLSDINYKTIYYLENSKSQLKNGIVVKQECTQKKILNKVFFPLIADEDFRVREAAANALCNVIPLLFTPAIHSDNDPITAIAFEHTIKNLSEKMVTFKDLDSCVPPIHSFTDPLNSECFVLNTNHLFDANLSDVVYRLFNGLQFNLENKHSLIGYCNALAILSNKYPTTQYPNCWGCDLSETSIASQMLNISIALISTNPSIVLDLSSHQNVLTLTANILEGLAYNLIKINFNNNTAFASDLEWGLISNIFPYLAKQMETVFNHLLRIMNIYSSIIDEPLTTTNIISSITNYNKMPVIQTLSNSSLSPIRKKTSLKGSESDKIEIKKSDSEKSDKEKFTKFGSNSIFVRLNEIIRSTYLSSKTSMDLNADKMSALLNVTLSIFGRILELSTIRFISRYAEEILYYLKIVFSLEPSLAVKNVRQLLKCIFGTNFIIMFTNDTNNDNEVPEEHVSATNNSNPNGTQFFTNGVTNYSEVGGLYEYTLSTPYTKFTQFYASMSSRVTSSFGSNDEIELTFSSWLRKKIEKRVSLILDKNISTTNSSMGLNSKASLTSHIRLFEPVVIKALKQYTITSDIRLQCEVLDLLSQLVQLRVNYCLLDSEQIFIGFVLKQFEFIESGHFDRYDRLIGHIFFFLILLSYERYHSKPIIGIPKIIQLCDGILASGQYPQKFALPSLQPIVEDLILLRNPNKVDSNKELETQREVIVADCLKLVQFPPILQILTVVTKQSKRDGEEKWKKISRQITDILLPQLVKQTIQIDSYDALEVLHQLFESVSPSVFRPVDILLKALFAAPQPDIIDNYYFFHRWTSLILVVLRLLIVQVKEEVVLTRLEEIKSSIVTIGPFGLPVIPTSSFVLTSSIPFHMSSVTNRTDSLGLESEEMFAQYLLQIIQLCSHEISIRFNTIYDDIRSHCDFLIQQLANYMLMLTHMFQSGSFRRVAKAAMTLIKKSHFDESTDDCVETNESNSYLNGFSLNKTNTSFLNLMSNSPTLALQWFNLLMLLNYEDNNEDGLWNRLIRPNHNGLCLSNSKLQSISKRRGSVNKIKNLFVFSPSVEIIRRGSLILFCDFVCENMNDAEHMTWLIVQNINEIIKLSNELPVSEFICAIHRNSASSGLLIQAINARCDENLKIASFSRHLLNCLERVHPTQSISLISFLIEKIVSNPSLQSNYLLMSEAENLAIKRLNSMTSSHDSYSNQNTNQLTAQDLDKLLIGLNPYRYTKLLSLLESFRSDSNDTQTSHPLSDSTLIAEIPEINKQWFLNILNKYCRKHSQDHRAANLLNKLSYDDIVSILSAKEFALEILGDCIEFGDQSLVEEDDKSNTKIIFSAVLNRINLLKASLNAVLQHIGYFINAVPTPHYPFLPHSEMSTPKEARHRDKLIELFGQTNLWNYLFKLSFGFLSFLEHHSERSISSDLLPNILRISVLYSEAVQYMTETVESMSFIHVIDVLNIMRSAMNCNSIFTHLSAPENISYQCSFISGIHSLTQLFFGELPKLEEPENFAKTEKENPEWKHPHRACIRLTQLVCFIEDNKHDSRRVPPIINLLLKKVILLTARLPLVNSFVMVPVSVWNSKSDSAWNPTFSGEFGTVVPTIGSEFLHIREILDQFCYRVMSLGWNCRVQFEEIWMSLLGVLGANSVPNESVEDQSERINICMTTTKAISELLLLSTLSPQPGNPIRSKFVKQKNEKLPAFLHSTHGSKLQLVREPLLTAISSLTAINSDSEHNVYDFGQISIELLRHSIKSYNSNELSPSISSTSSSSDYSPLSPNNGSKNISSNQEKLENDFNSIDIHSILHFLLDLYGQLLTAQQSIQLPLLTEICKSTVLLSDLFTERMQFEWLLDTFLELHRMAQISEDEIMSQYLVIGICKSSAVLGLETEQIVEKCKKCIETSLKSHYLPTRIATIHGLKYIFEFRGVGCNGKETLFLPLASDYLLKHLSDNTMPSSYNLEHVEQMWKLAFHLVEFFVEDFSESEFAQKIFQLSLKVLTDKSSKVYHIVVNGLDHLILCEKFSIKDSNQIVKSTLDRFKSSNCQLDALLALNLILSATYFVGSVGLDLEKNIDDSEEFLLAMEKMSVIFERLKTCLTFEAQQICNVLPHFLCEFFPTQDILNKCIGEFLSGQQTHAKHLANILFVVFNKLQTESHLDTVHDWVILSLSSFTQLIPISQAIWSLTSFLISASLNPWIRCAFAYNQTRFGRLEDSDRQLFFIVCHNFYNELKTEQNREVFRSTFQNVAEPNSPYSEVLRYLQISKA